MKIVKAWKLPDGSGAREIRIEDESYLRILFPEEAGESTKVVFDFEQGVIQLFGKATRMKVQKP